MCEFSKLLILFHHRYKVAEISGIPVESKEFEHFLQTLDSDDLWDERDQFEKGYKALGMKRYKIQAQGTVEVDVSGTKNSESTSVYSEVETKGAVKMLANEGGDASSLVKIEVQEYMLLKTDMKSVRMGETMVSKLIVEMKKNMAALGQVKGGKMLEECHCLC